MLSARTSQSIREQMKLSISLGNTLHQIEKVERGRKKAICQEETLSRTVNLLLDLNPVLLPVICSWQAGGSEGRQIGN